MTIIVLKGSEIRQENNKDALGSCKGQLEMLHTRTKLPKMN